jgi:hypothetical protein
MVSSQPLMSVLVGHLFFCSWTHRTGARLFLSNWRSLVSMYRQMRQLAMVYMLLRPVQFMDEDEADLQM